MTPNLSHLQTCLGPLVIVTHLVKVFFFFFKQAAIMLSWVAVDHQPQVFHNRAFGLKKRREYH